MREYRKLPYFVQHLFSDYWKFTPSDDIIGLILKS